MQSAGKTNTERLLEKVAHETAQHINAKDPEKYSKAVARLNLDSVFGDFVTPYHKSNKLNNLAEDVWLSIPSVLHVQNSKAVKSEI